MQVNAGGAAGAWRVLNEMGDLADVITVQDHGLEPKALASFVSTAEGRGWIATTAESYKTKGRWGERVKGGGITLVKKYLRMGRRWSDTEGEASVVITTVGDMLIMNAYAPPRTESATKLMELITKVSVAEKLQRPEAWLLVGDLNQDEGEQHQSPIFQALAKVGGVNVAASEPSRWGSSRRIDWRVTNAPSRISAPYVEMLYVSDHKPFITDISFPSPVKHKVGELVAKPKFDRPPEFEKYEWRKVLEQEVEEMKDELKEMADRLENPMEFDVQEEMSGWYKMVHTLHQQVAERMIDEGRLSNEQTKKMLAQIKASRREGRATNNVHYGGEAHWRERQERAPDKRFECIKQTRRRRWIARASNLRMKIVRCRKMAV